LRASGFQQRRSWVEKALCAWVPSIKYPTPSGLYDWNCGQNVNLEPRRAAAPHQSHGPEARLTTSVTTSLRADFWPLGQRAGPLSDGQTPLWPFPGECGKQGAPSPGMCRRTAARCYAWQSHEADHRLCPGQHPEAGHLWDRPPGWSRPKRGPTPGSPGRVMNPPPLRACARTQPSAAAGPRCRRDSNACSIAARLRTTRYSPAGFCAHFRAEGAKEKDAKRKCCGPCGCRSQSIISM
jgi:hypothetical protein